MLSPLRVGIVCDLAEERWFSMDLVAEQLVAHLRAQPSGAEPVVLRPALPSWLTHLPGRGGDGQPSTMARLAGRYGTYPAWLRRHRGDLPVYHVVDHSYAHLVAALPAGRTIVTCHDLDTFRCLFEPDAEPRGALFRRLVGRTLAGLQSAARIACVSETVAGELRARGIVDARRIVVVPNGVHPALSSAPDPVADEQAGRLLGRTLNGTVILHVGSSIPRKRVDVLIRAFAEIARQRPDVRLVRVGALAPSHRALAVELGVQGRIVELPFVEAPVLGALYRRAAVSLFPSEREGFGLPVLESLACGTPVVASDIPALRETGGDAAVYCRPGDARMLAEITLQVLSAGNAGRPQRLERAAAFTWHAHAVRMDGLYREVAGARERPEPPDSKSTR